MSIVAATRSNKRQPAPLLGPLAMQLSVDPRHPVAIFFVEVVDVAVEVSPLAVWHAFAGELCDGFAAVDACVLLLTLCPHEELLP